MIIFNKILNGLTPKYLLDIIPALNNSCYNTRAHTNLELTQFYRKNNNKKTKKNNKTKQNKTFLPTVLKNGTRWMLK